MVEYEGFEGQSAWRRVYMASAVNTRVGAYNGAVGGHTQTSLRGCSSRPVSAYYQEAAWVGSYCV